MSFQSLRRVLRSARKGLCSTCSRARFPQLEAAGAGHVGCLIYTFETLGQLVKDDHDVTAVHVAARKGQTPILIYLIENDLLKGMLKAKNGATPAHDAAGTGQLECLRYLISHTRLSVNDIDVNNGTPLHWAVQSGHIKVATWLVLEAKAPIDCVAKNGVTPLHLAATKNHCDLVKWLVRYAYKNLQKPRRLVNAKDKNGATPLYHASHAGHLDIIQWLAEKAGGDPTIRSNQGLAPLHAATIAGHLKAVQYLFQFGSASAPGGLRTSEGACALHFAAAEGHSSILQWLLSQKECSGNERDYYQSTPMHDAAERGHLKNIQLLCQANTDFSLTDIEGNTPQDLAEKNGQTKCVRYLNNLRKQRAKSEKGSGHRGNLSRSKTTRAEMIDSYRNAPPHQIPVNVFEGEEEEDEGADGESDSQWATLRDLIGNEEVEELGGGGGGGGGGRMIQFSDAEKKRRKLEEDMRREADERRQKREELLRRETDIEQEIRQKLLSEEPDVSQNFLHKKKPETGQLRKKSGSSGTPATDSPQKRLSLPAVLSADAELSQRGLVEKRTKEFEGNTPHLSQKKSNFLSKLRWSRKSESKSSKSMSHSQSWDSALGASVSLEETEEGFADEEDLPEPPPVPTVEYLLGKRPVNLRKRASDSLRKEIQQRAAEMGTQDEEEMTVGDELYDSDGHSSVGSAHSDHKHRKKKDKLKKKKRRGSKEDSEEETVEWNYNKLSIPQSSPPRERKVLLERRPTPMPPAVPSVTRELSSPLRLDFGSAFDEVSRDLQQALSDAPDTPSSLSPLHSPSPKSPVSPAHTSTSTQSAQRTIQPKRAAPKLPPHLQNKQMATANTNTNNSSEKSSAIVRRPSPISKIGSSRGKSKGQSQKSTLSDKQAEQIMEAAKSPTDFMNALTAAISSSPKQPRFLRQEGVESAPPPRPVSPTLKEIERHVAEMQKTLVGSAMRAPPAKRPPSPENDSDSSEFTSSSDDDSSTETTSSSDEETTPTKKPQGPRRPIMARNIGMSASGKRGNGAFSKARLLARYPRLLRRNMLKLEPILEVPEELIFAAPTFERRAAAYRRLKLEKRYMKAWRRYMQIMRSAYRKAEKIIRRKRRELLARSFYAWIQVRNMGAVEKVDMDRAQFHYQKRLIKKMFSAWHFHKHGAKMPIARSTSLQWLNAEERYLNWINEQLLAATGNQITDIEDSLADGILIIKAISYASGARPPKYLAKPRVRLHCQDNWKTAHKFMQSVGINMYGIEPADLANLIPAAIYNMFNVILKWEESRIS